MQRQTDCLVLFCVLLVLVDTALADLLHGGVHGVLV